MRNRIVSLVVLGLSLSACTGVSSKAPPRSRVAAHLPSRSTPGTSAPVAASEFPTTGPNVRPGEKPPFLNAAGRERTDFGAIVFAKYFIQSWDWAIATNNPVPIIRLSLARCTKCTAAVKQLEDMRRRGRTLMGARISVTGFGSARPRDYPFPSDAVVTLEVDQSRGRFPGDRNSRGTHSVSHNLSLIFLKWTDAGWRVVEFAREAKR